MTEIKVLTAEEQVANILAADARRVRRLTWATVGLWVMTVVVTGLLTAMIYNMHSFTVNTKSYYQTERDRHPGDFKQRSLEQIVLGKVVSMDDQITVAILFVSVAVALQSLSALGTVLLVHASRRATLRQVQTSLAVIASQLSEIQRIRVSAPSPEGG